MLSLLPASATISCPRNANLALFLGQKMVILAGIHVNIYYFNYLLAYLIESLLVFGHPLQLPSQPRQLPAGVLRVELGLVVVVQVVVQDQDLDLGTICEAFINDIHTG